LIPLPIFCCLKNTYFWEISTLFEKNAMVPKEETRVEIGEWIAIWGAESKGAKGYLGQTRDGCIVFQVLFFACCFCSAAVRQFSSITVRKS
jgi:hypothetical protein